MKRDTNLLRESYLLLARLSNGSYKMDIEEYDLCTNETIGCL